MIMYELFRDHFQNKNRSFILSLQNVNTLVMRLGASPFGQVIKKESPCHKLGQIHDRKAPHQYPWSRLLHKVTLTKMFQLPYNKDNWIWDIRVFQKPIFKHHDKKTKLIKSPSFLCVSALLPPQNQHSQHESLHLEHRYCLNDVHNEIKTFVLYSSHL